MILIIVNVGFCNHCISYYENKNEYKLFFENEFDFLLKSDNPENDLNMLWISTAPNKWIIEKGKFKRIKDKHRSFRFEFDQNLDKYKLKGISTLNGRFGDGNMLQKVLKAFNERFFKDVNGTIRESLLKTEDDIRSEAIEPLLRQDLGIIYHGDNRENVIATVRVFDGTSDERDMYAQPSLPMERELNRYQIVGSKFQNYIEKLRAYKTPIYELGKFSVFDDNRIIDKKNSVNSRVTKIIDLFLLKQYFHFYPEGLFVAHTTVWNRVLLFKRKYGLMPFEAINRDSKESFDLTDPIALERFRHLLEVDSSLRFEFILVATGNRISSHLSKRYQVPNSPFIN